MLHGSSWCTFPVAAKTINPTFKTIGVFLLVFAWKALAKQKKKIEQSIKVTNAMEPNKKGTCEKINFDVIKMINIPLCVKV